MISSEASVKSATDRAEFAVGGEEENRAEDQAANEQKPTAKARASAECHGLLVVLCAAILATATAVRFSNHGAFRWLPMVWARPEKNIAFACGVY